MKNFQEDPELNFQIASAIRQSAHISEYIKSHHAWWDSSGYPEGQKEKAIPLLSRMISIINACDRITSSLHIKKQTLKKQPVNKKAQLAVSLPQNLLKNSSN